MHAAPTVVATSGLAAETGFLPVEPATPATSAEGIFAVGNASTIAIAAGKFVPKADVFAEAEAKVVAANVGTELAGRAPHTTFDGSGVCFVEVGDRRAAFTTGELYAATGPQVHLRRPGPCWHLAKAAFEPYWMQRWP